MRTSLAAVALLTATTVASAQDAPTVESLLRRMTLEEKLAQLLQFVPDQPEFKKTLEQGAVGSVLNTTSPQQAAELQRGVLEASPLRIPLLVGHDVIHGYRTIFPIPLGIAASWDPAMAELAARVSAREARAAGIHWTFAPMLDVARDPRWGRVAEGAGEDPLLVSAFASAYVRGFQGDDPSGPDRLLACAKHFAAYGGALGGRDYAEVEISERTLREVYLPPFRAAVDAGVRTVMSAFNTVFGVPATASPFLLDEVLRREWRFRGMVVSDWASVAELLNHGAAATREEAALRAITAGVDLNMWDGTFAGLAGAVRERRLSEAVIDDAVRRVLQAKFDAGLFEQPVTDAEQSHSVMLTPEHRAAARDVARRSLVLLKNEGALPLRAGRKLAVVGPLAAARADMLGPWHAEGRAEDTVSLLDALRAARMAFASAAGGSISTATDEEIARAVDLAKESDVVVAALGESRDMSGEAASRASLDLPGRQQQLFDALESTGKPIVVVLFSGRPLAITRIAERANAVIQAWFPGTEAGHAVLDVLRGEASPSGRLPMTVPRSVGQVPTFYAHLPTGRPASAGNRYSSKYADLRIEPLYPFGHGLTYTRFEYGGLALSAPTMSMDGSLVVSADVRNAGTRAGEEVVQLYVRDVVASVSRPVRELKGFERVSLAPGETRRVSFTLTRKDLEFWLGGRWVTEPGEFKVWVAPNAAAGVEGTFRVVE